MIQDGVIALDKPTAETSVEELTEIVVNEYRRAREEAHAEAARAGRPGPTSSQRPGAVGKLRTHGTSLKVVDRAPLVEIPATGRLIAVRDSGPGTPAAPAGDRLRLLPSGPDLVHKPTPRGTRTIDAPNSGATGVETPRKGIQPR